MGQLWHHLKHCKQAIGSTNIIFLRPTDGWRFAGAAAPGRTVHEGASTSRANTSWLALTNGLQRRRARAALTTQRTDSRGKSARGVIYERPSCGREGDDRRCKPASRRTRRLDDVGEGGWSHAGILAAVRPGINNARLIVNRAYGFHSADAALALIMLT